MKLIMKRFNNIKIGIVPLPIYLTLLIFYLLLTKMNAITNDLLGALGILIVYSYLLEAIGKKIPIVKDLGGKVLLVTFSPAYMVYKGWLPEQSISIITDFMNNNNFLTFFISLIVVGSIASMNRDVLIKATSRIIIILLISNVGAISIGLLTAYILGLDIGYAYFFIVVPVMAGGVGEGALPLSISYASLLGMSQPEAFGKIIPCVFIGGLIAVMYSSILNKLGEKYPQLSGDGVLVDGEQLETLKNKKETKIDMNKAIIAGVFAITIYFISLFLHEITGLPSPILLLIVVMILKIIGLVSDELLEGGSVLYQFTVTAISPLLLFGVGVAMTPWEDIISVFTNFRLLIVLFTTVSSVVIISYLVAKKSKLYPVDTAIVISCCSGQGGTGALAILSAGNRMILMPFAQVAVRIGGAITVTTALTILNLLT